MATKAGSRDAAVGTLELDGATPFHARQPFPQTGAPGAPPSTHARTGPRTGSHTGGDCLAQAAPGAATLRNPEPRFYIVGMKSYGRNSSFLMRVGYEQVGLLVDELAPLVTLEPFQAPPGKADGPQDDAAAGIAVPVAS